MNINSFLNREEVKLKNRELILSLALTANKKMFDEHIISYQMFQYTEALLLKELKMVMP